MVGRRSITTTSVYLKIKKIRAGNPLLQMEHHGRVAVHLDAMV